MIKAEQVFFWTFNLKGKGFHGDKATILYLTSEFLFIIFTVCKTLFSWNRSSTSKVMAIYMYDAENVNSNFLDWEDTLNLLWDHLQYKILKDLLRNGSHKALSQHILLWCRAQYELEMINPMFPVLI